MRIVFMGSDGFSVPSLSALGRCHQVVAVVTQPDRPAGRSRKLTASPVKQAALAVGVPVLQPAKARDESFLQELRALKPEMIVVVAYGQILPQAILDLPERGCVNVHSSLLPKYRGASPVAHALLNGDSVTGVTTMRMEAGLDTGPIFLQKEEPIAPADTTGSVEERLAKIGAELLLETLEKFPEAKPQNHDLASYAKKLTKEEGHLDWTRPALELERRVRAFNPWPSSFTFWEGKRLQIWSARVTPESGKPGVVIRVDRGEIVVGAGQGSLLIEELQREGGRRLKAEEFLCGLPLQPGQRLG